MCAFKDYGGLVFTKVRVSKQSAYFPSFRSTGSLETPLSGSARSMGGEVSWGNTERTLNI